MKRRIVKTAAVAGLCLALLAGSVSASAACPGRDTKKPGPPAPGMEQTQPDGCMTIREAGEYTLTGNMRGTVYVDPGEGDVRLILDGAQIDGAGGPAIMAVSGDRLNIELAGGSVNAMRGGSAAQFGAAVYSQIPVAFEGEGRLDMRSAGPETIRVENGEPSFNGGDIRVQTGMQMPAMPEGQAPVIPEGQTPAMPDGQMPATPGSNQNSSMPAQAIGGAQNGNGSQNNMPGGPQNATAIQSSTDSAGEIVTGITENSAMALEADYENATTYDVSENSAVKISSSGTYIVTGTSDDGSITVTKSTTGVVLVLENLDLTSTSSATLSINKNAEVQVIISGNVTLTDNEDPANEDSDDYDGAAIKVKAEAVAFITGDGTLTVNGNAKNGIKAGDDSSLIIGGDVTANINAVNDGINGNYDVTILSGDVTISSGDDGIHADHILTIGVDGKGPNLTVVGSTEGLEGTVVNIAGGRINVTSTDDGINAANADAAYEGVLGYSVNITGGDVTVTTSADGIDSNGNVNLIGGSAGIRSASAGGDAGIDYDGELYVSDDFRLNNASGVAGPDNMGGTPGQMGNMPGGMGGFGGQMGGIPGGMGGPQR